MSGCRGMTRLGLALVLIGWPSVVAGQDSTAVEHAREAAIRTLEAGQRLRVHAPPDRRLEGVFAVVDRGHLFLTGDSALAKVAVGDIDRLWVRGRATGTGALVGGVAGTAIGVAYGFLIGEVVCDNIDCRADTAEVVLLLGLGGGAAGGLAGALTGLAIPKWHQRFP